MIVACHSDERRDEFRDIGMPNMDGYEVARRTHEHVRGKQLKLITLTGWGQEDDCRRERFDHHLIKPADIGAIQALLISM